MVFGSPCICIRTTGAPVSAANSTIFGSRRPLTSFIMSTPLANASCATCQWRVSIDNRASVEGTSSRMTGMTRPSSSSGAIPSAPGPGRFPADVDDVRPFLHHLEGALSAASLPKKLATVGERVGGDVQDPHDQRVFRNQPAPVPFDAGVSAAAIALERAPDGIGGLPAAPCTDLRTERACFEDQQRTDMRLGVAAERVPAQLLGQELQATDLVRIVALQENEHQVAHLVPPSTGGVDVEVLPLRQRFR